MVQKLSEQDSIRTGWIQRHESTCGNYEIGIYPVLFGYRIRGGRISYYSCDIDWCFATDVIQMDKYYFLLQKYVDKLVEEGKNPFSSLPGISEVKPCFKDERFVKKLEGLDFY